jgi:hypothetical protein
MGGVGGLAVLLDSSKGGEVMEGERGGGECRCALRRGAEGGVVRPRTVIKT